VILEEGRLDGVIIGAPRARAASATTRSSRAGAGKTLAEMPAEDKNALSHRSLALAACGRIWADRLGRGAGPADGVAARAAKCPLCGLEMDASIAASFAGVWIPD